MRKTENDNFFFENKTTKGQSLKNFFVENNGVKRQSDD